MGSVNSGEHAQAATAAAAAVVSRIEAARWFVVNWSFDILAGAQPDVLSIPNCHRLSFVCVGRKRKTHTSKTRLIAMQSPKQLCVFK